MNNELSVTQLLAILAQTQQEQAQRAKEQAQRAEEQTKLFQDQLLKQQEQMEELIKKLATHRTDSKEVLFDRLRQRIEKFSYDPEDGHLFSSWLKRFKDIVEGHDTQLTDEFKTDLLRTLLDNNAYTTFTVRISPTDPRDLDWNNTVEVLEQIFGPKKSLFRRRVDFSRITCAPGGDFITYGNCIIAAAEAADVKGMTEETIKCLQYVSGLQTQEYVEIRTRLLRMMDSHKEIKLLDLISESQAIKTIGNVNNSDIKRYIEVLINNQPIQLRLDTGAEATLISRSTWMAIGQPHLTAATTNLCTANGQTLDTDGTFQTSFAVRNKAGRLYKGRGVVYVTETNDLMRMPWIDQLPDFKELFKNYSIMEVRAFDRDTERGHLTEKLKHKYSDVFRSELGHCTKAKASL